MTRRAVLAVAGWLAAAVAATVTGLGAVELIGTGIAGPAGPVVDERDLARDLAAAADAPSGPVQPPIGTPPAGTPTAGPSSTGAPSTVDPSSTGAPSTAGTGGAGTRTPFATTGGTVVARCDGRTVSLVLWTPAQGYAVKQVDPGPDDRAEVTFEGRAGRVEVRVSCPAGRPDASVREED
ncbi:septum formation initiator [Micromonospora sp. NBC_01699]|uniref:septum formation initiator n=1 Tax=Micromonospora sp. NBC_01699 TaxID=2975984 RepID=UPI002E2B08FC|nr:septum formation initiator [Micromonospora sp. NBC_01699]